MRVSHTTLHVIIILFAHLTNHQSGTHLPQADKYIFLEISNSMCFIDCH